MNPVRRILVHLDSSPGAMARVRNASTWALSPDAEVVGLYAVTPWLTLIPPMMDVGTVEAAASLSDWDKQRLGSTRARFEEAYGDRPMARFEALPDQSPYEFVRHALYADMLVLGPRAQDGACREDVPRDFLAQVIVRSGKPALLAPSGGLPAQAPESVLVAWNETREAARAVDASLPWLRHAREVHIVSWHARGAASSSQLSALAAHLQRHGVRPTLHHRLDESRDLGERLWSEAGELGADMLVMGCYGHSRASEWVLGGTTASVLHKPVLPVLMVH